MKDMENQNHKIAKLSIVQSLHTMKFLKNRSTPIQYTTIPHFYSEDETSFPENHFSSIMIPDERLEEIETSMVDGKLIQFTPIFSKIPKPSVLMISNEPLKRSRGRKLSICNILWILFLFTFIVYSLISRFIEDTKQQFPERRYIRSIVSNVD